ncbi:MAG: hypothetical protein EG825_15555 [Rhodocyclaceae bacterium]|nr:hypothetical protein [Rhodocyclaceae bacterium]
MIIISLNKTLILLAHAFVVWALCGATIAIGRANIGMERTLVVHAVAAPLFAAAVSLFYYRKYNYTTPLQTALVFLCFVMAMDAGLVAPVFEKSYNMFTNILGTWIPFGLIFLATLATGMVNAQVRRKP